LTWLAWGLAEPGDFSAALSAGERAVQLSERHDTPFGLFHACMGLGIAQLMKDEIDRAITTLLRAAAVAEASDLPLMANAVQALCGSAYLHAGNFRGATARLEQATKYTESAGHGLLSPGPGPPQ
jgi:tetratricopeptide (TPR) repeat protein